MPYDAYYLIPLMAIKQLLENLNHILFGGKLIGRLNFTLGLDIHKRLLRILAPYCEQKGALIPVLQKVQEELGYLPEEAISEIAYFLGVSESEVYGVASFYAQFRFIRQGEHTIKVCQGTACHVRGGRHILEAVEREISIQPGETTEDYKFSLEVSKELPAALASFLPSKSQGYAKQRRCHGYHYPDYK